ncbi:DUF2461 family protein [Actinokineospora auranticolor]|uniref:Uncharacterized protein DUF2461 n=1 Tax=Actinokineospora auranticolor TaxID=155976 RepID=A0A2S6GNV5_9PSEU|nr:DUF2461 family protein [Actinokineospora auranticolor]PPK66866.1 uncharacterized protein DUF2461 [Actinokineospora auranticolor]
MPQFTGWPEQAYEVLLKLEGIPTQQTRDRVRADRERLVRRPMLALLDGLASANPRFADYSVWHYGKNVWWWQHQGAIVRLARNVEIGLRFDLDGLHVKGAWHYPDPAQVRRFRAAVAEDDSGCELERIIAELPKDYELHGDLMRRAPREYPPSHPRAELLRYRSMVASRAVCSEESLHSAEALAEVLNATEELAELLGWLARHVPEQV